MTNMFQMVKEFQTVSGDTIPVAPTIIDDKSKLLCIKLMQSELTETIEAMADNDIVETFDGLIDLLYVVAFTANKLGLADYIPRGFAEVHANNMTKFPNGVAIRDASGKIKKPDGYKKVDLSWIKDISVNNLAHQCREAGKSEK